MLRIESPPSSKKLSLTPTLFDSQHFRPDRRQLFFRRVFAELRSGQPISGRCCSGAGNALRSTLPLLVSGNLSRNTKAAGTMYSGSFFFRCSRKRAHVGRGLRGHQISHRGACRPAHLPAPSPPLRERPGAGRARTRSPPARFGIRESLPDDRCGRDIRCRAPAGSAPDRPSGIRRDSVFTASGDRE